MQQIFKRSIQYFVRPIKPFLKSRVAKIRSGPARGMRGKMGQWTIPFQDEMEDDFLRSLDLKNNVAFDVGANVGAVTLFLGREVTEKGKVIAFEPHPGIVPLLLENIQLNNLSNVTIKEIGVGDTPGSFSLVVPNNKLGSGSFHQHSDEENTTTYQVAVAPIDQLINDGSVPPPDFVKVDTEGLETAVLNGARECMKNQQPSVMLEMHGETEAEKLQNATDVVSILLEHDYVVMHIEHRKLLTIDDVELAKRGHLFACSSQDPNHGALMNWVH